MTDDDFKTYLGSLDFDVAVITGNDGHAYIVVRDYELPNGALQGKRCDIAIQRTTTVPYVPPPAIHTRPRLVPMDMNEPLKTQESKIGPDWQYWSRIFDHRPTPKILWAHILTVLCDDRWPTN